MAHHLTDEDRDEALDKFTEARIEGIAVMLKAGNTPMTAKIVERVGEQLADDAILAHAIKWSLTGADAFRTLVDIAIGEEAARLAEGDVERMERDRQAAIDDDRIDQEVWRRAA